MKNNRLTFVFQTEPDTHVCTGRTICCPIISDVIMGSIASQITSLTIVYSIVYSDADQSKHQRSASLAFVKGIHRGPVNSPHTWPVTRKMFPFDDVIMIKGHLASSLIHPIGLPDPIITVIDSVIVNSSDTRVHMSTQLRYNLCSKEVKWRLRIGDAEPSSNRPIS